MKILLKIFAILFVLFLGSCLFLLTRHIGGLRGFVVMSGSMEPTIATGSLVITSQISPSQLQKGEVITFVRPDKTAEIITHRINTIKQEKHVTVIQTKGDKNPYADSWVLAGGGVIGRVQIAIPYLGYLLKFTQTKLGILFFILIPAVYIIVEEIQSIVNLLTKRSTDKKKELSTDLKMSLIFFLGIILSGYSMQQTKALISDQSSLTSNHFAIFYLTPTPDCDNKEK